MWRRLFLSERSILVAVSLNALVIFVLSFPSYSDNFWLRLLDELFILFFVVEVILKMRYLSVRTYFSNPWNRFDFTVVVASLPSLLVTVLPIPNTSIAIIFRLFRLVRMVRLLRFVPNIDHLAKGLARAFRSSIFVFLSLLGLNIFLSLFTCHIYHEVVPEYFGDPLISSYTIFQLFTVEGWNDIPALIAQRSDPLYAGLTRFYFVIVVLLGGIFGMSLANAVFVDEMTIDNNMALEKKIDNLNNTVTELKKMLEKGNKLDE